MQQENEPALHLQQLKLFYSLGAGVGRGLGRKPSGLSCIEGNGSLCLCMVLGVSGHQRPLQFWRGGGEGGGSARRQTAVICIPDSALSQLGSSKVYWKILKNSLLVLTYHPQYLVV